MSALTPEIIQNRYDLLCRALAATPLPDESQAALDVLDRLHELIHRELLVLARLGSPDDFAEIYRDFTNEQERFREFCAYPQLAQKSVVAFGGAFSSGKSSLINALIGHKLMVTDIDPTTALPAYVLGGEADAIWALNLHRRRVPLSEAEFASLTHEEREQYGSEAARAFLAAFVTRRNFPWTHLAFIDTPGYSAHAKRGARTDADIALAQLNAAHAIVWTVSVKQGDIPETDLQYLARLDPDIPRLIVVTHVDQIDEQSIDAVVARMTQTLANRNLPVVDLCPASNRPRHAARLAAIRAHLDQWNSVPHAQRFAYRFKILFTRYQRGLDRERRDALWQASRIKRIAFSAPGELAQDINDLQDRNTARLRALDEVDTALAALRQRFFTELKRAGQAVGIPLPEPHEVELLEYRRSNLLQQLIALREDRGETEPEHLERALATLRTAAETWQRPFLIRRKRGGVTLATLRTAAETRQRPFLIRQKPALIRALTTLQPGES